MMMALAKSGFVVSTKENGRRLFPDFLVGSVFSSHMENVQVFLLSAFTSCLFPGYGGWWGVTWGVCDRSNKIKWHIKKGEPSQDSFPSKRHAPPVSHYYLFPPLSPLPPSSSGTISTSFATSSSSFSPSSRHNVTSHQFQSRRWKHTIFNAMPNILSIPLLLLR